MKKLFGLLSPAMIVACVALSVALGGTSYAAIKLPKNSVGNTQLKSGAVTGAKVRANTLTGAHVNEARLGKVPSAQNADNATSAITATSAATASSLLRLHYQSAAVSVPAGFTVTRGTVTCPTGLSATGGGAKLSDPSTGEILDTNPAGNGWEATAKASTAQTMNVFVICVQAAGASTTP